MTMREAFTATMIDLLEHTPNTVVVTADIGAAGFRHASHRSPGRVVNVGIREQAMIGVAAGFALVGFRPYVHSYAPFLIERPFEQIKLDLVHQELGAVLVGIGGSYDAAAEGRTHQAPGDVALLSTLSGVDLHVPGHPEEVAELMRRASGRTGTEYLRLSEAANRVAFPADGRVRPVKNGSPAAPTVLSIGPALDPTLEAVSDLDVTVLYASTVRPFDQAGLRFATGAELLVVEPYLEGTTLPMLYEAMAGGARRISVHGVPAAELRRYGSWQEHRAAHGLDAIGIRDRLGTIDDAAALRRRSVWVG